MDTEATKMVMSRIQNIDPENASKIMGYILIQDQGEKEMIRLAFGPENLLLSVIKQAKAFLDISSNTSSSPSTPSSPSPFNHQRSPRIIIPNNGFHHMNPPSPNSPWSLSGSFPDHHHHRGSPRPASYAAVVNGGGGGGASGSSFYNDLGDEYNGNNGLQVVPDQLSFLDDTKNLEFMEPIVSPGGRSDSILFPYTNNTANWAADPGNCGDANHHHLHRRSCSVNDVFLAGGGSDDMGGGFGGWRPCMYFAKGFCKNGTSCKFVHGGFGDEMGLGSSSPTAIVGSPTGKIDGFEDLLRIKAIQQQQQQRIAAMAGGGAPPFPFNRCMNFLNDNPRSAAAAALMIGEDFHKFGRCRPDRNDFAAMGLGSSNSSSRQIYLTFPADSTFKEEDVSSYFSLFGPVQDVRIPYQQKRMFGFVTFVYPDTVKAILAKGNPHFVCDSRVLVKPYKEKGKIPDKKHQQIERGDFSGCLSPTALEAAEPFDHIPFGARMFNQEMILRRKLEERELQQALEFQDKRLMNLQLTDFKNHQLHTNLSAGVAIRPPTQPHSQTSQSLPLASDGNEEEVSGEISVGGTKDTVNSPTDGSDPKVLPEVNEVCSHDVGNGVQGSGKEEGVNASAADNHESLEHILPDNLFASPTKLAAADHQSIFSTDMGGSDNVASAAAASSSSGNIQILPATSAAVNMASIKSCYFQMPRNFCGQEAIEM